MIRAGFSGLAFATALLLTGCAEISSDSKASKPSDSAAASLPVPQSGEDGQDGADAAPSGAPGSAVSSISGNEQGSGSKKPAARSAEAASAPHIYMALQPDSGGPVSVIFAIDQSRDNTPSDDPAIRITPMDGQCNPQQLRWHEFSAEQSARPAYGPEEAARGITAQDLPAHMASLVTAEMLEAGLILEPEDSRPQNVCTQKLLQQMIIAESAG